MQLVADMKSVVGDNIFQRISGSHRAAEELRLDAEAVNSRQSSINAAIIAGPKKKAK